MLYADKYPRNGKVSLSGYFQYYDLQVGEVLTRMDENYNRILFLLAGDSLLHCNEFVDHPFSRNQMFLIPQSALASFRALTPCHLLVCRFSIPLDSSSRAELSSLWHYTRDLKPDFYSANVISPLTEFCWLLVHYLKDKVDDDYLHEIKQKELFSIFRCYYCHEELARLFYPILSPSLSFKMRVYQNYLKVSNGDELASMLEMSRSVFDRKFKEAFGTTARQWILRQIASHLVYDAVDPDVTITDLMDRYNFNSGTQFNRFCRQQFGCTPQVFLRRVRDERDIHFSLKA